MTARGRQILTLVAARTHDGLGERWRGDPLAWGGGGGGVGRPGFGGPDLRPGVDLRPVASTGHRRGLLRLVRRQPAAGTALSLDMLYIVNNLLVLLVYLGLFLVLRRRYPSTVSIGLLLGAVGMAAYMASNILSDTPGMIEHQAWARKPCQAWVSADRVGSSTTVGGVRGAAGARRSGIADPTRRRERRGPRRRGARTGRASCWRWRARAGAAPP